jgi:hypothetical protein
MDVYSVLGYLLLGGLLGAIGQIIRVIVGLKKSFDETTQDKDQPKKYKDVIDVQRLIVSPILAFIIGVVAGVLGTIGYINNSVPKVITSDYIVMIIGIGYAITGFIEGFI